MKDTEEICITLDGGSTTAGRDPQGYMWRLDPHHKAWYRVVQISHWAEATDRLYQVSEVVVSRRCN